MWMVSGGKAVKVLDPKRRRVVKKSKRPKASVNSSGGLLAGGNPFPVVWRGAKQHYTDTQTFTVGTAGVYGAETAFTLNDQFDPRFSVGGHQPYGRDTFSTMYERYKVTGVTVDVTFCAPSGPGVACGIIFGNPTNTFALAGNTYDRVKEAPQSKVMILSDAGSQQKRFKKYFPMWKVAGCPSKDVYDSDIGIYDALVGNSPSADGKCFMRVAIADLNLGSAKTAVISVKLTMHTEWYQRKILAQS